MRTGETFDIAVVGSGVFGAWTAYLLANLGAKVVLIDAYGPGNSRASSGGESRLIRMGYGADEIYTRSAQRSLTLWQRLFEQIEKSFFRCTGVLWLAREDDSYSIETLATLERVGATFEKLDHNEVQLRYPQLNLRDIAWSIFERNSGVLLARQALQALVQEAQRIGVSYLSDEVEAPAGGGRLQMLTTSNGATISAGMYIFACGPWLPKMFPDLLRILIQVTRQEVFYFGVPAGDLRFFGEHMPAWIDFYELFYGIPNLDGRGFKLALDKHGPEFDPDTGDRLATIEGLAAAKRYLVRRMPALANAPVVETRVCQYENTSQGDFLIDRHPEFENIWLVGGGSGHGFKHGPAVGEYVTGMIAGKTKLEPRFSLALKEKVHERKVY
jgi:monomeric sarcosine oxidase